MELRDKIRFRVGTLEDVDRLTELHFLCFDSREHLATLLGKPFIRDMYRWFVSSENNLTVCAYLDEKLLASSTVCRGLYHQRMFRENKRAAIRAFLRRPWLALHPQILRRVFLCFLGPNETEEFLSRQEDSVIHALKAIRPDHRGTGLSRWLNEEIFEICRQRGWQKVIAVIYEKNVAARRSAEKNGYKRIPLSADSGEKGVYMLEL